MKLQAALKKINNRSKKTGVDVSINQDERNVWVRFEGSNQTISFYKERNGEDDIYLIKVTRDGDVSDPHTDYYAGSFVDNITQALNWVAPLPPKYRVGSLVRFKDNKRNGRWGINGELALVIEATTGGNYKVRFTTKGINDPYVSYAPTYSERDLELIN